MIRILQIIVVVALAAQLMSVAAVPAQETTAIREDFNNLDNWKPLNFPKIKRHSEYEITLEGTKGILTARSNASASGIIFKGSFNPFHHQIVRWRWKVDNVYSKTDPHTKQGDDYPLRVYVIFEYDSAKAGLAQRAKYGLAKKIYGEYPPLASLNYVWASRNIAEPFFDNPYTDRAKMIPLRAGTEHLGQWVDEEVNVLADYRRVFGEDPPASASLAIMNDSDNTGEASVSHMEFIEVRSGKTPAETPAPNP
ncbi:MAG: DUF3047 domain-containing protein [Deltaproteobacteria bacterium]|nr:DUF3047 domain-containing protein [Deltaproteobacteria bacterium]